MNKLNESTKLSNYRVNTMQEKLVSIVIPTFNRPQFLEEAILSALNQIGYSNYEVIVSDNNPSIESAKELKALIASFSSPRLHYHQNESNLGMTGNWNQCLKLAQGEYISILHDDDLLHPHFLQECMKKILGYDLVVCGVMVGEPPSYIFTSNEDDRDQSKSNKTKLIDAYVLPFGNISPAPGIIFKKQKALELNGFDDSWYPCSDYDFWIRYCLKFKAIRLFANLAFYRVAQNESQKIETRIQIAKKAFTLQKNLMNEVHNNRLFSTMVPACATGLMVASYCQDPVFRNSDELGELINQYRLCFPRNRVLAKFMYHAVRIIFMIKRRMDMR